MSSTSIKLFGYLFAIYLSVGIHNAYREVKGTAPSATPVHALLVALALLGLVGTTYQTKNVVSATVCSLILFTFLAFFLTDSLDTLGLAPHTAFILFFITVAIFGWVIAPSNNYRTKARYSVLMTAFALFTFLATFSPMCHHPYYVLAFATILYMAVGYQ